MITSTLNEANQGKPIESVSLINDKCIFKIVFAGSCCIYVITNVVHKYLDATKLIIFISACPRTYNFRHYIFANIMNIKPKISISLSFMKT